VIDTSPFGIVSQWAADGNIPELDCCGEAVGNEFCLLRHEEIDAGLILNAGRIMRWGMFRLRGIVLRTIPLRST
jgi:hypothetical protein